MVFSLPLPILIQDCWALISYSEHLLLPGTYVKGESEHIAVRKEKQQNIPNSPCKLRVLCIYVDLKAVILLKK